ncbi:ubiquinol-cytochrome C chaperone family protein [Hoeflea poritis]|uniref:Ubiquinol-cytochrome C chaperone n=1 Tax=Hoeflea poritis TaxID=2993659 RepID=A0ABT4VXT0_9HYPH|nr:ubiquinol-cytochrome C chaperone family protein [Hoeflea poritis]MDA4848813.1 ubiquinol-cytochrome C chaperone [Hoeflea poritis]
MIFGYFSRKRKNREIVDRLYRQLTEFARNPAYYAQMNVPDTVMGRFEMLCVVMVLFFRRTDGGSPALRQLAQDVVDTFFEDMDHALRELGVGDVSVPKRMKRLARMFYGRAQSCGDALNDGNADELADVLFRNIYPPERAFEAGQSEVAVEDMAPLAAEVMRLDDVFKHLDEADLLAGVLMPGPESTSQESRING